MSQGKRRTLQIVTPPAPKPPKPAPPPPVVLSRDEARAVARELAERSEAFSDAVSADDAAAVAELLADNTAAAVYHDLFGLHLFRLVLRLDEAGRDGLTVRPYDVQIEARVSMLELGAFAPAEPNRRYGAGLLYLNTGDGWRLGDVLPIGAGGTLDPADPSDAPILAAYRDLAALTPDTTALDAVERALVAGMAAGGDFNLEEVANGLRLWRDYIRHGGTTNGLPAPWAAGIAYLIGLFDRHSIAQTAIARTFGVSADAVGRRARELAFALNATQFDDRYATRADPVKHYAEVFGEIGINFKRGGLQEEFDADSSIA